MPPAFFYILEFSRNPLSASAGGQPRARWSLRNLHEGAPSRLPLAGWGFSSVRQRTSINKRPTLAKPVRVGHPLHTIPLTPVVTLVFAGFPILPPLLGKVGKTNPAARRAYRFPRFRFAKRWGI